MALRRPKNQRGPGLVTQVDPSEELPAPPDGGVAGESVGTDDAAAAAAPDGQAKATDAGIPAKKGRIGEILLELGSIDQAELDGALELQKESDARLGSILVEAGALDEDELAKGLAAQYGVRWVALDRAVVDPKVVEVISEDLARALRCIPLSRSAVGVTIVVADPTRPGIFEELVEHTSEPLSFAVASPTSVDIALDKVHQASSAVSDAVRVFEARVSERSGPAAAETQVSANAPIVQVVNTILTQAVRDRASDVHIEPMGDRVRIRNRIDGALHEVLSLPQSMAQALVSRIKIMADMNIVERRRPQDGQIETEVDGSLLDIRVSTTSTQYGEKTVLRILDKARALYDLSTLGMPPETEALYADIIRSPYGMVVCAGPTGSGKTTTLYASLMAINSDEINVMTVEDPVEYTFPTINQISIHEQA
ncbi:MAG: Flp pilus assembly complex ATPase component TadA, partial [Acidimicrobiales bacterium]|nr:Flp pilus assembly complex ATPase component TadA [Acidimicrobiales bacterium]